jgi:WD40 repeat protein
MPSRYSLLCFAVLFGLVPARLAGGAATEPLRVREVARFRLYHYPYISALAFSPNGKQLVMASGSNGLVQVDLRKRKVIGNLLDDLLDDPDRRTNIEPTQVAFSHNGQALFARCEDGRLLAYDSSSRKRLAAWDHLKGVTAFALSHDGRWLASCHVDRSVHLWKAGEPGQGQRLYVLPSRGRAAAFSPDNAQLALVDEAGGVTLFDVTRRAASVPIPKVLADSVVAWDGPWLALALRGQLRVVNVVTRQVADRFREPFVRVAVDPRLRWLAVAASETRVLRLSDQKELIRFQSNHRGNPDVLAFSRDGRLLALGDVDGDVSVWEIQEQGGKK